MAAIVYPESEAVILDHISLCRAITAVIKLTKIVRSTFPEVDCLFREGVSQQMTLIILKQKAEKYNQVQSIFLRDNKLILFGSISNRCLSLPQYKHV